MYDKIFKMENGEMDKPHGIIVFGASGAGSTTLGRELARLLNFEHYDTDDYSFEQTDPPYTKSRPLHERLALLRPLIKSNFVLTGCIRDWDGAFDSILSLAVFVMTPTDIRIERLEKREYNRNGERIKLEGDLYNLHQKFIEYVSKYDNGGMEIRSLASQEAWAKTQTCPVIRVDGTIDYRINAANIAKQFYEILRK